MVMQSTTANRAATAANQTDFSTNVLPKATAPVNPSPGAQVKVNAGDTLSSLAAKYGMTVNDFVAANKGNSAALPDANNPNLIISGQMLNIPSSQAPAGGGKSTAAPGGSAAPGAPASGGSGDGSGSGTGDGSGSGTPADGSSNAGSTYDDGTTVITGDQAIDKQIAGLKSDAAAQITSMKSTLDAISGSMDSASQALIASLQADYDSQAADLTDKYSRISGGLDQQNDRSGRARYAPILAQGILSGNEVQLQMKLSDLHSKMMLSVSKAQQAMNTNDLNTFNKEYANTKSIQDELAKNVQNLYTLNKNNQAAKMKADQEAATSARNSLNTAKTIAPSLSAEIAGIKDPAQQQAFIASVAKQYGLDPTVLQGFVTGATTAASDKTATQVRANAAAERAANKTAPANNRGGGTSGKFTYTASDITDIESSLKSGGTIPSLGSTAYQPAKDGYVDHKLYTDMAGLWQKQGGTISDFIKEFPPKDYINPTDNDQVPTYFQNPTKSKTAAPGTTAP